MVFEENNEDTSGLSYRCPGMECADFASAGGENATWQQKIDEVCENCTRCKGNAPINPDDVEDEDFDVDDLVFETAELICDSDGDGGRRPDFSLKEPSAAYTLWTLFNVWREAEKQVEMIQNARMQAFIKAWMTEK